MQRGGRIQQPCTRLTSAIGWLLPPLVLLTTSRVRAFRFIYPKLHPRAAGTGATQAPTSASRIAAPPSMPAALTI